MTTYGADQTAERVLELIGEQRCIAVIRSPTTEAALRVSRELVSGGFGALEITYTTPHATELLRELRAEFGQRLLLGAGTVTSAERADAAARSGADFLVSPGSPPELVKAMLATGRLVIPGVLTPTEIMAARAQGVLAVKLFPASIIGPTGLATLRGPFADVAIIPTGGIKIEEIDTWLDAGAHAVGIGGALASGRDSALVPGD